MPCSRSSAATRSGRSSDSQYCNPAFDKLYDQQNIATTADARKTILAQMQNLIYDQAVYDILYYDANLAAYRTDHFGGWQNQPPANGIPLFSYGTLQYTLLTDATAAPSPTPAPSAAPERRPRASHRPRASPAASPAPTPARRDRDNTRSTRSSWSSSSSSPAAACCSSGAAEARDRATRSRTGLRPRS